MPKEVKALFEDADDEPCNLFWTDDGWCVDLREYRYYTVKILSTTFEASDYAQALCYIQGLVEGMRVQAFLSS